MKHTTYIFVFLFSQLVVMPNVYAKESGEDFSLQNKTEFWNAMNTDDVMSNWRNLYDKGVLERSSLEVILDNSLSNAFVNFFNRQPIKTELLKLSAVERIEFVTLAKNQDNEWFSYLENYSSAITRWKNLNGNGKLFAKNNPKTWLYRLDRYFVRQDYQPPLTQQELLDGFGNDGVLLVDHVEAEYLNVYASMSKTAKEKRVLISALRDKGTGDMSGVYHNFYLKDDFEPDVVLEYINNMQANVKKNGLRIY